MFSVDLLIWLGIVGLVTVIWHFAVPEREEVKLSIRRERIRDLTQVMHLKNQSHRTR
jgi:hypothetical protein